LGFLNIQNQNTNFFGSLETKKKKKKEPHVSFGYFKNHKVQKNS
jgi:hypothetical protein